MNINRVITGLLLTFVFFSVLPRQSSAQDLDSKKIDDTTLIQLYALWIENPYDQFITKRISEEREQIRNIIESELNAIVNVPADEEQIDSSGELSKALDRQRSIVVALKERLRERKIDLDLLIAEEEKFYLKATGDQSEGASTDFRTTKTHEGLLAKKAILEERISLLNGLIPLQEDRLSRLIEDQRRQQFGVLIDIGTYAGIIFLIWLLEKLIRRLILVRIPNRLVRYSVVKFFTGGIYILTLLWLFGIIYSKNPGILASFAIVGAGIAIAMQDVVKDVVGWVVIHQSRLYTQGDRITLGNRTGEVIDIGLLHTKVLEVGLPPDGVLEQTGKVLSIPNSKVLTESLNNYHTTSDFIKAEIKFAITFESNWKKAEELLTSILLEETEDYAKKDKKQHSMRTRTMYMYYEPGNAIVYKDIAADGVEFLLRFTVPVGKKRPVASRLAGRILSAFDAESDIDLAYKTTRYYKKGE